MDEGMSADECNMNVDIEVEAKQADGRKVSNVNVTDCDKQHDEFHKITGSWF